VKYLSVNKTISSSPEFCGKLLKQYRETVCLKGCIQQTPTKLNQEQLNVLSSIVANNNTWMNFVFLKQQTGVLIGRST